MNTKLLFECIEAHDVITIYRHVAPDSDALGSQFGLKQWIMDTYPEKKVYALGYEECSKSSNFPASDEVDDKEIENSLAIILDTANTGRIDDGRWSKAKSSIRVDHHIIVEKFADHEIIEDIFGATCEILGFMLKEEHKQVSAQCAQYLYGGLIADTLRFSIATITSETLKVAAFLLEAGANVAKANEENFSTPMVQFRYENYIRSNFKWFDDCIAYIIVHKEDYEKFGLSFNEAKEKVFVLGGVDEFQAWALFVEKERNEQGECVYNGSLRSKNKTINDIANRYHGGGHRFACGVKGLLEADIKQLLIDLSECVKEQ
ncbi:MAG: bifunctional oligoribonuclease/PAP phosphatase NrnA [Longicatena sp.]